MKLGKNYWKLWTASVTSNFGDGMAQIAYPWLASLITRDGFKLGLVVLAGRLPWLLFSLPAGVITDRVDRRKLMIWMDVFRSLLTFGVALVVLANQRVLTLAGVSQVPLANEDLLLVVLIAATFLFGMAEVLRDNSAQTFMPSLVDKTLLEKANGRLWGAEVVMNSFVGPPIAGLLLGAALVLPFFVHSGTFLISAVLLTLIVGRFRPDTGPEKAKASFRVDLREGFRWLWHHHLLRPLAITLGAINAAWALTQATYVLFAQEILGLGAAAFGLLATSWAIGGLTGSLLAPRIADRMGKGPALFTSMVVFAATALVVGLASSAVLVWVVSIVQSIFVMAWNVITVSLRQRIIPDRLLGRVNSVYRFFGWGMMSIGAVLGGVIVSVTDPAIGRDWSLRAPFLIAAGVQFLLVIYALPRINSASISAAEAEAVG